MGRVIQWGLLFCVLIFLLVANSYAERGQSTEESSNFYAKGASFNPNDPTMHAIWRGRKTLPLLPMRTLCSNLATYLGLPRENTTNVLLEIAAAESDFGYYVRQVKGPAQSVWQIEPETAQDMHTRLPKRNPELYAKIVQLRDPTLSEEENVVTNLEYGGALCVGILVLKGYAFEKLSTVVQRGASWKKWYNTYLGKGTLEGYCQKVARYVGTQPETVQEGGFDATLYAQKEDLFAERDRIRFKELPANFEETAMGRYYLEVLRTRPMVFAEVPEILLQSGKVQEIMHGLVTELVRKVQKDPASVGSYQDMPWAIFAPLVRAAMEENALLAYPALPAELQEDAHWLRLYESQKMLRKLLQR